MTEEPTPPGSGKTQSTKVCSICGNPFVGFGNNPEPIHEYEARCCDYCNQTVVIPERLKRVKAGLPPRGGA